MALVMLPCDLPWWPSLQRQLRQLQPPEGQEEGSGPSVEALVRVLTSIHALCNVGLDPDESETPDPEQFVRLSSFLNDECDEAERGRVLGVAVPCMVRLALRLKELKPPGGLHYSLQQQPDCVSLDKRLAASLLAHAFFSSFPKRSLKTHPTLLDFNFSLFFSQLHLPSQQAKFRSLMHYYCLISQTDPQGTVTVSRRVLDSTQWLTVEDWLESNRPLCPVLVHHQPRPERAPELAALVLAPCSRHVGEGVLAESFTHQCRLLAAKPEMLATLLFVEALEDNETLLIEGATRSARINPLPPHYEPVSMGGANRQLLSLADPEDFTALPPRQYEEDNVLRELNKLLLAFGPANVPSTKLPVNQVIPTTRRLSPIGESFSSTPPEVARSPVTTKNNQLLRVSSTDRKGRFIALGSSGELLPISRNDIPSSHPRLTGPRHSLLGKQGLVVTAAAAVANIVLPVPVMMKPRLTSRSKDESLSDEDDEEFHSARESLDHSEDGQFGHELDTPQRRCSFAQRLREALRREASALGVDEIPALALPTDHSFSSASTSSSSGPEDAPPISPPASQHSGNRRWGGSCGFMLEEEKAAVLIARRESGDPLGLLPGRWLGRACSLDSESNVDDSVASQHNSEYSSDLEELYEHFSRWLEHDRPGEEEAREEAVLSFARGLLKRTLSDCGATKAPPPVPHHKHGVTRSLSEAAGSAQSRTNAPRRLAAHLASLLGDGRAGPRPVASGAWWGGNVATDPQLKAVLQWLAASQTQCPCLLYYTEGIDSLAKLDTLCRVIVDRQWSVGELTSAVLRFAQTSLEFDDLSELPIAPKRSLFDELIGSDKPVVTLETEL